MKKNNYIIVPLIFSLLTALCFVPLSSANIPFVGIVKIPVGASPEDYYSLKRGDQPVAPLTHNMPVLNGDEIIPHKGRTVTLSYIHTGCGEVHIKQKTTVHCLPQDRENAEGFLSILTENVFRFVEQNVKREKLLSVNTRVNRGFEHLDSPAQKLKDYPCFSDDTLYVSTWPLNGATILRADSILFRWTSPETAQCADVQLNICPNDDTGSDCQVISFRTGEMKEVRFSLQYNKKYFWFIARDSNPVSGRYEFTVLGKRETDNIVKQLGEVRVQYRQEYPMVSQALYLQTISDAAPDLDLYYDSYLVLRGSEKSGELFEEVLNNIYNHYWKIQPAGDLEAKIEAFSRQNKVSIEKNGVLYSGDLFKLKLQAQTKMYAYPFMIDSQGMYFNLVDFTQFKQFHAMKLAAEKEYLIPETGEYFTLDKNTGMETITVLYSSKPENEGFDFTKLVKIKDPHILNQYLERFDIKMKRFNVFHQ